MLIIRAVVTTIIIISTAMKIIVSVIEVVIIIVRVLIRIWVASIIELRIVIISTCLLFVMLINSWVEAISERVWPCTIVIARWPGSVFSMIEISLFRLLVIVIKIFVFIVILRIGIRFSDFFHALVNDWKNFQRISKSLENIAQTFRFIIFYLFSRLRLTIHRPKHIAMPKYLKQNHSTELINKLKCTSSSLVCLSTNLFNRNCEKYYAKRDSRALL